MDFNVGFLTIVALSGTLQVFFYCYFGKLASESYEKIPNCLYKFNWYELPVNFQKYFTMMIQNAQKPIHYHGFGFIILELETFMQVS